MPSIARFDAVFFDSGGTIWLSPAIGTVRPGTSGQEVRERRFERVAMALTGLGYPVSADRLAQALPPLEESCPRRYGEGFTWIDLMLDLGKELGLPIGREDACICVDAFVGPRYANWLSPRLRETLEELRQAGLPVGIISNTYIPGYCVDRLLRGVELLRYFPVRIYSGDEGVSKPDIRIFELARRRAGLTGGRILYVGDSVEHDIRPARQAGWSAALIRSSAKTSDGAADFEFDHMPELLEFVLG